MNYVFFQDLLLYTSFQYSEVSALPYHMFVCLPFITADCRKLNDVWVAYNDIMFIQSIVKNGCLVQNLERGNTG